MTSYDRKLFYFALLILVLGCGQDAIDEITDPDTPPMVELPEPGIEILSSVSIQILDENNNPLPYTTIEIAGQELFADKLGNAFLSDINILSTGTLVKASKDGYLPAYSFILPSSSDELQFHTLQLINRPVPIIFDISEGVDQEINDFKIIIPSNSLVDNQDKLYNGSVSMEVHYYDPLQNNLSTIMPGMKLVN